MLMFFDILALDKEQVLGLKQHERRRLLDSVIRCIPSRADLAEYQIIRFSSPHAAAELRSVFAKCITARVEGLVMKPADEPYFNFENSRTFRSCYIKLKKEAIGAFGDVGDFAIVGAAYDSVKAKTYMIPCLQWTDFYIGCLENKDEILRANAKPRFVVITTVSLSQQILEALMRTRHVVSLPYGTTDHFDLRIENGVEQGRKPSVIFTNPPVVDIRCFAFDKEGNTGFWTMRFPTVTKMHADRTYLDTVSFLELQRMAKIHKIVPEDEAGEELKWIKLLEATDPRGIAADASTQYTSSSAPTTPSPRRRFLEDSGRRKVFLIREDTAGRQQQVPDSDILIADASLLTVDHVPSSTTSVGSHMMMGGRRLRHLVSVSSIAVQNTGRSSKRTADASSESPVQPLKRQKASDSPKSSCLHSPALDKPLITIPKVPPNLGRPLSDITNSSLKPYTSPNMSKLFSIAQNNTFKATANHAGELTKRKSYLGIGLPYPTPPAVDCSSSASGGGHHVIENSPPSSRPRPGNNSKLLETPLERSSELNGICQQASASCIFINCSFLLTPCIAGMPQLTEDLLPSHGAHFILDPQIWLYSYKFPERCSFIGHKLRKLVLVEPRNAQETAQIFKEIQCLNLVKSDGKREWVEVYDFRLVEYVSKMEMGKRMRYNVWRHFWIGAA
jgi:DNA ligase-4